jgi:hypothetical protein
MSAAAANRKPFGYVIPFEPRQKPHESGGLPPSLPPSPALQSMLRATAEGLKAVLDQRGREIDEAARGLTAYEGRAILADLQAMLVLARGTH